MRRFSTLIVALLACGLIAPGVSAFFVSPMAAQERPGIGEPVPVTDEEGTAVGSIAVTEVSDPFTEFDPAYPPEAGTRYVALTVAIDADMGERFDIGYGTVVLQDDAGFLWDQISLYLPDDALIPELSSDTLGPGSRVSAIVGFTVPEGREPARVFYQPESSRLVDLAELSGQSAPTIGDTVPIVDSEGGAGSVTVTEVADPFEGFDPTQPPPDGSRLVLITLEYENSSDGRFFLEPYGLVLRDANGDLWTSASINRAEETEIVPDLTNTQLAPGDRVSGVVAFAVPEEIGLSGIFTGPVSGQLIQLAALGENGGAAPDDAESTPLAAVAESTPSAAIDEETSAAITGACVDVAQWLESSRQRIAQAGTFSVEDATLTDLETLAAQVSEYAALADAQLAEQAPATVEAVDKALAATLNAYAGAMEQMVGASEPGKNTIVELTEGVNTFNDAGARLQEIEAELATIASECGIS